MTDNIAYSKSILKWLEIELCSLFLWLIMKLQLYSLRQSDAYIRQ